MGSGEGVPCRSSAAITGGPQGSRVGRGDHHIAAAISLRLAGRGGSVGYMLSGRPSHQSAAVRLKYRGLPQFRSDYGPAAGINRSPQGCRVSRSDAAPIGLSREGVKSV